MFEINFLAPFPRHGPILKSNSKKNTYLRELHTILKFGTLISSSLKIESVLSNAMKWAEDFIDAEASSIYELDEEKDDLFIRIARGEKKDRIKKIRFKKGEGIAGLVVKTGQPLLINDVGKDKRFSDKFDRIIGFKTRSMICVPLVLRGKSVGAIQVLNKRSRQPFSKADLEILTSMSQQIAVAMENAKLYQRLEKKFNLTARELKSAQEQLIRSERLAAMGNLINGIAHEIRNPITIIGGLTRRIRDLSKKNIGLRKYADIILSETARLERLVKKVHQLVDIQFASMKTSRIETVIEKVLNEFKEISRKQHVTINLDIEEKLPPLQMDPPQMVTALCNIFENALESMDDKRIISLLVKRDLYDRILIMVRDTGSGIAPENLDSLYDPFVTSKPSGIGLGLTMVYQIIMNHHGEIKISSEKNEGTTVEIRLPTSQEQA